MSLSSLNSIEQSVFELESGNKNVDGQTEGQTDVGYVNLTGGLVTCNPPKNFMQITSQLLLLNQL